MNMLSIFVKTEPAHFFGSKARQTQTESSHILLEGSFELHRNGCVDIRQLKLTASQLYLVSLDEATGLEDIEEIALDYAFIEPCSSQQLRGFTLRLGDLKHTFLCEDRDQANRWVHALKSLCVCTDFNSDFEVGRLLGQGSSSSVYLVEEKLTGLQFAAKIIPKMKLVTESQIKCLCREVSILRRLAHPSIVKIERVYEDLDQVCIVLEFIKGPSLLDTLKRNCRLPEERAINLTRKLLEVLAYLDCQQVVHRDIKPGNILINEAEDSLTLIDFGLAVEANDDSVEACGSPGFVAPEILNRQSCSPKADVFSAGVLLYSMLSGHMPYGVKSQRDIVKCNLRGSVSFPKELFQQISMSSINFVIELLIIDSYERPDATQALRQLPCSPSPRSMLEDSELIIPYPCFDDVAEAPPEQIPKSMVMSSIEEIDKSLRTNVQRNKIPRSNIFVLDASILRKSATL